MSTKNTSVVPATEAQKGHILDMWKKRLEDRNLTLDEAQVIITGGNLYVPVMEQAADLLVDKVRSDIENTVVRMVRNIRRNRSAQQTISDTKRKEYLTDSVVATMPVGQGPEERELVYRRLGSFMDAEQLEQFMIGFEADPQAQTADNEADPAFADSHPNICQWDRDGKVSSYLAFDRWRGERSVLCFRRDDWFIGSWWVCGFRK